MMLRLLLFFFGGAMKLVVRVAGWRDPDFKRRLTQRTYRLQIRTRDQRVAKTYHFVDGKVLAEKQAAVPPDFLIEWQDQASARRALVRFSPAALIDSVSEALLAGKLTVEYDVAATVQLATVMKDLPRALRRGRRDG